MQWSVPLIAVSPGCLSKEQVAVVASPFCKISTMTNASRGHLVDGYLAFIMK